MTYCHICFSRTKGYLVWGKPDCSLETALPMTAAGKPRNNLGIRAHDQENTLLLIKTPHMPELWPLPSFRTSSLCFSRPSDTSLRPRGWMFLLDHSPNPPLQPGKRKSADCLSPGCWQLLIAITLTGAALVSKAGVFQAFCTQSWGWHGKCRVRSSSHSNSGLHIVATYLENLAPITDAELFCRSGP